MDNKYRHGRPIHQNLSLLHIWFLNSMALLARQLPWWGHW